VPSGDRTAWWDLVTSSKNQKFYIKTASSENSTLRNIMTLTETGNVGIGTTDVYEAFQIGDDWTFHQNGTYAIARNFKYDGDDKRIHSGIVSRINFNYDGDIIFQTAPDGPLANPISWTHGLCVKNDGKVGIGTLSPDYPLVVMTQASQSGYDFPNIVSYSTGDQVGFGLFNQERKWEFVNIVSSSVDYFAIRDQTVGVQENRLVIDQNGNMGIGTNSTNDYKVVVNGKIQCTDEINICNGTLGCDFVFYDNYLLTTLDERKEYTRKNHHLINVPSAEKMQNNGAEVLKITMGILQNVEEHELYLYQQKSEINKLKEDISELKKEFIKLEKENIELKSKLINN
jgi:hypothetical protein